MTAQQNRGENDKAEIDRLLREAAKVVKRAKRINSPLGFLCTRQGVTALAVAAFLVVGSLLFQFAFNGAIGVMVSDATDPLLTLAVFSMMFASGVMLFTLASLDAVLAALKRWQARRR